MITWRCADGTFKTFGTFEGKAVTLDHDEKPVYCHHKIERILEKDDVPTDYIWCPLCGGVGDVT